MSTTTVESDRVRRHSPAAATEEIETATRQSVRAHAWHPAELDQRIEELGREWDIERTLEANASTLALTGAVLGTTVNRKWFWLTGGVLGFLFQHATSGWCPPLPVLRHLGVRTQTEIDRERYALKAVRGDFDQAGAARDPVDYAVDSANPAEQPPGAREPDRVRRYTTDSRQRELDENMRRRVRLYGAQPAPVITQRIAELEREWSIERYLQINVAAVGLSTALLAVTARRRWGYVTCAGLAFFLFHAVEGFDPPLPLLRRAGVRSRAEINREIYALKVLRGDFDDLPRSRGPEDRVEAALRAVDV